jgi:hypothetical protein
MFHLGPLNEARVFGVGDGVMEVAEGGIEVGSASDWPVWS